MSQHHDPVHPDGGHLSAEVLADLDLGLLDAESEVHARHHLDHCSDCQQLHADLTTLTDTLAGLGPSPSEPMPDEVWSDLVAVLSAEPVATPQGSATVVPLRSPARRRRPGLGLVAGAAGVALLGAIGVSFVMNDGESVNTLSGSSSSADSAGEPESSLSAAAFAATRSGTQYREDQLDEQVVELVAARPSATAMQAQDTSASPSSSASPGTSESADESTPSDGVGALSKLLRTAGPMVTDPAAAQQCLEDFLDVRGTAPLAVDIGIWQGKPAAVIVLPPEGEDANLVQVWVINPACDPAGEDSIYYFATIRAS
jgi:hypothetical protein